MFQRSTQKVMLIVGHPIVQTLRLAWAMMLRLAWVRCSEWPNNFVLPSSSCFFHSAPVTAQKSHSPLAATSAPSQRGPLWPPRHDVLHTRTTGPPTIHLHRMRASTTSILCLHRIRAPATTFLPLHCTHRPLRDFRSPSRSPDHFGPSIGIS